MEDTLGGVFALAVIIAGIGLNPCSNGRYSRRQNEPEFYPSVTVLILVLMEDTLGEQNLQILYFRGFDNNKTYQFSLC